MPLLRYFGSEKENHSFLQYLFIDNNMSFGLVLLDNSIDTIFLKDHLSFNALATKVV